MFHGGWSGGCPWTFRAGNIVHFQNNFLMFDTKSLFIFKDYLKRGDYNYIDVCWQTITNDAADTYNGVREAGRNTAYVSKCNK